MEIKNYSVYQIKRTEECRRSKFVPLGELKNKGVELTMSMYDKVYDGKIEDTGDLNRTLENVYVKLNVGQKPEGYRGHSLSISDLVLMDGVYYYVDIIGFKKIDFDKKPVRQSKKEDVSLNN